MPSGLLHDIPRPSVSKRRGGVRLGGHAGWAWGFREGLPVSAWSAGSGRPRLGRGRSQVRADSACRCDEAGPVNGRATALQVSAGEAVTL